MKTTTLALLVSLALVSVALPAWAGDLIEQVDGKWLPTAPAGNKPSREDFEKSTITVTDESYDYTYYRFEGISAKQRMEASRVKKVHYESVPQPFLDAGNQMGSSNFQEAISRFETIAGTRSYPDWVRMYSLWNMGRIYQEGMADFENALVVWDRLKKDFPKSRFLPDAIVLAGKALMELGRIPEAQRKFLELASLPGLPEGRKKLGQYYVIYIKQKQGEASGNTALLNQALSEYRRLLSEVENDEALREVATRARLGIGDCLLALGQHDEALDFFRKIADSATDKGVLAGAYNGLGRCYKKQRKWKDALLCFLRTVVLYSEEIPEQTAMAYVLAGDSYALLRKGEDWKDRAKGLYRDCMQKFPGTSWARRAREGLEKLR